MRYKTKAVEKNGFKTSPHWLTKVIFPVWWHRVGSRSSSQRTPLSNMLEAPGRHVFIMGWEGREIHFFDREGFCAGRNSNSSSGEDVNIHVRGKHHELTGTFRFDIIIILSHSSKIVRPVITNVHKGPGIRNGEIQSYQYTPVAPVA